MTSQPEFESGSLAPLAAALRDRAHAAADEVLARADEDAQVVLDRARQQADVLLAEARARGAADGAAVLAAERAGAARRAREILLAAQRVAHDDLRAAAREAVRGLRDDEEYPVMLEALRDRALGDLGPGASLVELDRGGIVAEYGQRRAEYSLEALADDLVDDMVDREQPWCG